ncbi:hypothetical protein RCH09_003206 [Actimicrobium sp. GrIS 1.19]|uniref:hypothetical protein n=1 Tax=Actimicrobium sp. GrIS 1.19 TaxID=3071708 RepID=UPI002E04EB0E|nr:hypothetical protein [Actimicrobium sp. GrIS 1.19]
MTLPQGLYERLVMQDEAANLDLLESGQCALIETPSKAQRREHLIYKITSHLPKLLDIIVAKGAVGNAEETRAELQLIARRKSDARSQSNCSDHINSRSFARSH